MLQIFAQVFPIALGSYELPSPVLESIFMPYWKHESYFFFSNRHSSVDASFSIVSLAIFMGEWISSEKCESTFLALWERPSCGYKYWQISLRLICTTFINENNSWFLYTIKYTPTNIYFVPMKCKAQFLALWDKQIKQDMALSASQVLVWQNPGKHIQRLGKSQMVLGMSDDVQRQWLLRDARGERVPNR